VDQAAAYIFEIADIISTSVSFPYVRLFLLTTRRTKDLHNFAVDIKPLNGTTAPDQIPSPRSQNAESFSFNRIRGHGVGKARHENE
jgi:hypothetical protein